jgi:hypothetical protein
MNLHVTGCGASIDWVAPDGVVEARMQFMHAHVGIWQYCTNPYGSLMGGVFLSLMIGNSGNLLGDHNQVAGTPGWLMAQGFYPGDCDFPKYHDFDIMMRRPNPTTQPSTYFIRISARGDLGTWKLFGDTINIASLSLWNSARFGGQGLSCGRVAIRSFRQSLWGWNIVGGGGSSISERAGDACVAAELPPEILVPSVVLMPTAAVLCDCVTITPQPITTFGSLDICYEVALAADPEFLAPVTEEPWRPIASDRGLELQKFCELEPEDYIARYTIRYPDGTTITSEPAAFTIEENSAPTAPDITSPLQGEVIVDGNPFILEFEPATDPDGDDLQYMSRLSADGANTWSTLHELGAIEPNTPYSVNTEGWAPGTYQLEVLAFDGCLFGPPDRVCIEIVLTCPPVPVDVTTVRRFETWSDTSYNRGTRTGFVRDYGEIDADRENQGEERFQVLLPRASKRNDKARVFEKLQMLHVTRNIYEDFSFEDSRLVQLKEERQRDNSLRAELLTRALWYDLEKIMLVRYEANGRAVLDHPLEILPQEHMDFIMRCVRRVRPYFNGGYVEPTEKVRILYSWDNALSALHKLRDATGMELEYVPTCAYIQVNLVSAAGQRLSGPTANFDFDLGGVTVTLTDTSVLGSSPIVEWLWTSDAGHEENTQNTELTFATPGMHNITLQIKDQRGFTRSVTKPVTIELAAFLASLPLFGPVENFDAAPDPNQLETPGDPAGYAISDGRLRIDGPATLESNWASIYLDDNPGAGLTHEDFTGRFTYIEIIDVYPLPSSGGPYFYLGNVLGAYDSWAGYNIYSGPILGLDFGGPLGSEWLDFPYDSATHRFLGFAYWDGKLYWLTSPTALPGSWTIIHEGLAADYGFDPTTVAHDIGTGASDADGGITAEHTMTIGGINTHDPNP